MLENSGFFQLQLHIVRLLYRTSHPTPPRWGLKVLVIKHISVSETELLNIHTK